MGCRSGQHCPVELSVVTEKSCIPVLIETVTNNRDLRKGHLNGSDSKYEGLWMGKSIKCSLDKEKANLNEACRGRNDGPGLQPVQHGHWLIIAGASDTQAGPFS